MRIVKDKHNLNSVEFEEQNRGCICDFHSIEKITHIDPELIADGYEFRKVDEESSIIKILPTPECTLTTWVIGQDINKGENKMREAIANVYENTKEAVLVDKWFGDCGFLTDGYNKNDAFLSELFLKDHKEAILTKAKEWEEEENNTK